MLVYLEQHKCMSPLPNHIFFGGKFNGPCYRESLTGVVDVFGKQLLKIESDVGGDDEEVSCEAFDAGIQENRLEE